MPALPLHRPGGFSLLEIVVAIGIFAVGLVAVVGLFTPLARSVAAGSDAAAAARTVDAIAAHLRTRPWEEVVALLEASTVENVGEVDSDRLYASRDGSVVGSYADPVWREGDGHPDRDKFFEITLARLDREAAFSRGSDSDHNVHLLTYLARLRWPAFVRSNANSGATSAIQPSHFVRIPSSQQQELCFAGAVTR